MKSKLSGIDIAILVTTAVIADLLNPIPLVNIVVGAVSTGFFQLYFFIKGVKKSHYSLIGNSMEFIPAVSILPAVTAGVIMTIMANRAEEKLADKLSKDKDAKEKATLARQAAARNARAAMMARQQAATAQITE